MTMEHLIVGSLQTNCYILESNKIGLVIDPGAEPEKIIKAVSGLKIQLILATHQHFDHINALKEIKKATHAKAAIHHLDWIDGFDMRLEHGQRIQLGSEYITVLHTPGHTPGGCCFLAGNDLFSGDTLFPGGPGNTSFSADDEQIILKSIREKLLKLPNETKVYPGHGLATTIGQERGLY